MADLQALVDDLWERRQELEPGDPDVGQVLLDAVGLLDRGEARVAEVDDTGSVVVHEWLKRAILLLFRQSAMDTVELGPFEFADKIPLKGGYEAAGVRVVPGASARWGSFLDRGVILMPSYVNLGARVGDGCVLGEGVLLNPGIPVIEAETGEELGRGVVPPWCVAVQATRPRRFPGGEFGLPCVLVIRRLTPGERHDKATLNDLLRTHGVVA
jgi:2,3,4,5-tetrahydropyridine-2-carboxylate N-succinyltransferase